MDTNKYLYSSLQIQPSELADIAEITALYHACAAYQAEKKHEVWQIASPQTITNEINQLRHYKAVVTTSKTAKNCNNNKESSCYCKIAGVFTIAYTDPIIWGTRNADAALYFHRIGTHPLFMGKINLMDALIQWGKSHALNNNLQYLRLDTWANNKPLCQYYQRTGFTNVGQTFINQPPELPPHYLNIPLMLFEKAVK